MAAYWLLHELRSAAPKRSMWPTATFETIRCAFLKIAMRIEELKTRTKMALSSAYPYVQGLSALATSITARAPPIKPSANLSMCSRRPHPVR
jgi:hypothetical protein